MKSNRSYLGTLYFLYFVHINCENVYANFSLLNIIFLLYTAYWFCKSTGFS